MTTKPKIGATLWKQDLARAIQANKDAREAVARLLRNSEAGPGARALVYAEIAQALSANLEALMALKGVGDGSNGTEPKQQ